MFSEKVDLKKKRDFGDVLNAAFGFMKQEMKPLWKMIFLYSGIPLLIFSIFSVLFFQKTITQYINIIGNPASSTEFAQDLPTELLLVYLLTIVLYIFMHGLTYSYVVLYGERKGDAVDIKEVWHFFTTKFLALLGYALLTLFLMGIGTSTISFIVASLGVPLISGIGILAVVLYMIYVMVAVSMLLIVKIKEDKGYLESVKRCFFLIKSHWWQTFGLLFIAIVIITAISMVFSLPATALGISQGLLLEETKAIQTAPAIISALISTLGTIVITPIPVIIVAFQYYSLVEHKDNLSLLDRINRINNPETENE